MLINGAEEEETRFTICEILYLVNFCRVSDDWRCLSQRIRGAGTHVPGGELYRVADTGLDGQDGGSGIILAGVWCGLHYPVSSHIHPSGVTDTDTDITLHLWITIPSKGLFHHYASCNVQCWFVERDSLTCLTCLSVDAWPPWPVPTPSGHSTTHGPAIT